MYDRDALLRRIIDEGRREFQGFLPANFDRRDITLESVIPFTATNLPRKLVYDIGLPIMLQGRLGACTSHSGALMLAWFFFKEFGRWVPMSRRYIYNRQKLIDQADYAGQEGSDHRYLNKVLKAYGAPFEEFMQYVDTDQITVPGASLDRLALPQRILSYVSIPNLTVDAMRQALALNGPFIIGYIVWGNSLNTGGIIDVPQGWFQGAHSILVRGYDDDNEEFICRGHWDPSTNSVDANGDHHMKYSFVESPWDFFPPVLDAWTLVDFIAPVQRAIVPEIIIPDRRPVDLYIKGQEIIVPAGDAPPFIANINGSSRLMLPGRLVAERLGQPVNFQDLGDRARVDIG